MAIPIMEVLIIMEKDQLVQETNLLRTKHLLIQKPSIVRYVLS